LAIQASGGKIMNCPRCYSTNFIDINPLHLPTSVFNLVYECRNNNCLCRWTPWQELIIKKYKGSEDIAYDCYLNHKYKHTFSSIELCEKYFLQVFKEDIARGDRYVFTPDVVFGGMYFNIHGGFQGEVRAVKYHEILNSLPEEE
jgi:hypothetical protein